jgi:hypothetical protein
VPLKKKKERERWGSVEGLLVVGGMPLKGKWHSSPFLSFFFISSLEVNGSALQWASAKKVSSQARPKVMGSVNHKLEPPKLSQNKLFLFIN